MPKLLTYREALVVRQSERNDKRNCTIWILLLLGSAAWLASLMVTAGGAR